MLSKVYAPIKALIFLLLTIIAGSTSLNAFATSVSEVDHKAITIWSQGVRLAGDVYKPKNLQSKEKLPGILLVPGWGGNKKNLEKKYAPHFAKQGFIVLSLDFKGWGESEGPVLMSEPLPASEETAEIQQKATHVRKVVNPLSMIEDVRAALHYLGSEPQVMPDTLGVWGTSMGGGLALVAAATDDRVKALVDQMGSVNYKYNLREIPDQQVRHMEAQVARGALPAFPGPSGKSNPLLKGYPDWVAMKRFNPLDYVDQLSAATLIIDAEEETLFETEKNGLLVHESIKNRLESRYLTYPGGHYDMYKGENLKSARKAAIDWFVTHLKTN